MANTKEIQKRMKSIKDTMKITNAMYMISSTKLQKAKKKLADTEPYFYSLQQAFRRILRHIPDLDSIYFKDTSQIPTEDKKTGYIVVTADKGLAGAYNHNVIKMADKTVCSYLESLVVNILQERGFMCISTLSTLYKVQACTVQE